MIVKLFTDTSAVEKELGRVKINPYAREVVRQMLEQDRFRELFALRSESIVDGSCCIYVEPTPLLKAIGSAVMN